MYVEKPIIFNPENDTNSEKEKIVNYLRDSMIALYQTKEVQGKKYQKLKEKERKRNKYHAE